MKDKNKIKKIVKKILYISAIVIVITGLLLVLTGAKSPLKNGHIKIIDSVTSNPISGAIVSVNGNTSTTDSDGWTPNFDLPNNKVCPLLVTKSGYNNYSDPNFMISGAGWEKTIALIAIPVTHSITVTQGSNGTITPTGTAGIVTVNDGADQTFTITADPGYQIASITIDGTTLAATNSYTFINVTEDHAITAIFVVTDPVPENDSIPEKGSITIIKYKDNNIADSKNQFSFNLDGGESFLITVGQDYMIEGLTPNQTYILEEDDEGDYFVTITYENQVISGLTPLSIALTPTIENPDIVVYFHNDPSGDLIINKQVRDGIYGTFKFNISGLENRNVQIDITEGQSSGSILVEGLMLGNYVVTEIVDGDFSCISPESGTFYDITVVNKYAGDYQSPTEVTFINQPNSSIENNISTDTDETNNNSKTGEEYSEKDKNSEDDNPEINNETSGNIKVEGIQELAYTGYRMENYIIGMILFLIGLFTCLYLLRLHKIK